MTIKTTYNIGDRVYIYTKSGLQLQTIFSISVHTKETEVRELYYFEEYGNSYSVKEIVATNLKQAVKAIEENKRTVQLLLTL